MKKTLSACFLFCFSVKSFATVWTITNSGFTFSPDSITITQGDTVNFVLASPHNAQEVSQSDWIAGNNAPVIGFQTPVTGGLVTGLTIGTHYYVCSQHASIGMKGRIFVQPVNPSVEFVLTSSVVTEGTDSLQIAVAINNPNSNPTSVDINVLAGGTAAPFVDYSYAPITVIFPGGSPFAQIVTIHIIDDLLVEGTEYFTFQLAGLTNNATLGANSQHTITITDNDTLQFSISPASQNVSESASTIILPVSLNNLSSDTTKVTVHLDSNGTTATQGTDFYFNDTTLVWPPGSSGPISAPITIYDDNLFEPDETVKVRLVNPTNGAVLLNDTSLLVIQNNDTMYANCVDLFFSEYIEGTSNNKALEIYNPTSSSVDLSNYKIFMSSDGGTSTSIFGLSGMLAHNDVFVAANASANAAIISVADTLSNFFDFTGNDALALIHLTDTIDIIGQIGVNPGNGWIVDSGSTDGHTLIRNYYTYHGDIDWTNAKGTWDVYPIDKFDSLGFHHTAPCGTSIPVAPATIRFTTPGSSIVEGIDTVPVIIRIDNPSGVAIDVLVVRDDNSSTATVASDYNFSNQHVTFNSAGISFDTVYIAVLDDQLIEPTETAILHFVNPSANTNVIPDSVFTLSIIDNDTLTASFIGAGFSYIEGDTMVKIKVALSTFPTNTTTALISLAPGSATEGVDFIFADTTIIFLPNSTDTQGVWVHILDDNIVEPNEQINFNLSNTTNGAHIAISAYTLTIIDNDFSGINEETGNSLRIFPNPVTDWLFLETETETSYMTITDIFGNSVIVRSNLPSGQTVIDVSLLPSGMYFLNCKSADKNFTMRFIKNE